VLPVFDFIGPAAAAAAAIVGAAIDLRTGRIPNVLTASTALVGLGFAVAGAGHVSPWLAGAGLVLGAALMLPGHMFGATGAGDVKLMAALGAWFGPAQTLVAFLASAIAGGVLAVGHAWYRGRMKETLNRTARLASAVEGAKAEIDRSAAFTRFAYGPAIAVGAIVAALWG
jgi:prepilin peptidase CpaA